jgi:5-methylcytosine-specific restriction enzyme A
MSLNAALSLFLEEYPYAATQEFADNPVADFVRHEVPDAIKELLPYSERYMVHGSVGQGNWARVPWVAVFDRLVTDTAQNGYYVVYLVKEDFSGAYLSLNQGVTIAKNLYGADAKEALRARAIDFLARLGKLPDSYIMGPVDLSTKSSSSLGAYYEQGSICAKYYARSDIPPDGTLEKDLKDFMDLYFVLATKDLLPSAEMVEEDEANLDQEDLRTFRERKRIERNQKLALKAKKVHGYVCQASGFSFEKQYGTIGRSFIEAHHLTPLYELKGQKVTLDPKMDFAVLCSNCHRMIHKSEFVSQVKDFRAKYVVGGEG